MRKFSITLFILSILAGGCGKDISTQNSTPAEKWDSLPRLERIAKDYAKQHKIDFDFTGTKVGTMSSGPFETNIANIFFDHGVNRPVFAVRIDRDGKVIVASVYTLKELPRPRHD